MSSIKLYCCGGAGVNIGTEFASLVKGKKDQGYAGMDCVFIDTSRSNMSSNIPNDKVYLVEGLDGSGKQRDMNYNAISEVSNEILHKYQPDNFNIVIHSASGGSGSVLGPVIASEIMNRGNNVIVILVGHIGNEKEAVNTLNTLKSYESISTLRGKPVPVVYRENNMENTRGKVDEQVKTIIYLLNIMLSGDNRELDSADLKNFLNYQNVTSYVPKLTMLDVFDQTVYLDKGQAIITLLTLTDDQTSSDLELPVAYQAVGFLPDSVKKTMSYKLPLHACMINGFFNKLVDEINSKLKVFESARSAVVEKQIVKPSDLQNSTKEGLIL